LIRTLGCCQGSVGRHSDTGSPRYAEEMDQTTLFAYVVALAVIIPTPGPSTLLAASHGMTYGWRGTLPTIAGDLSANTLQMVAASIGVGAIVTSSRSAFALVKWIGVAYLAYLGIRQFLSPASLASGQVASRSARSRFAQGFVNSAANPKAVIFFAALFPQFLNDQAPLVPQAGALMILFLVFDGASLSMWTVGGWRLARWLVRTGRTQLPNRIAGGSMLLGASWLALKRT